MTLRVQVVNTTDGTTLAELKEIDPDDAHRTKNRHLEQELPDGSLYYRYLVDDSIHGKYGRQSIRHNQGKYPEGVNPLRGHDPNNKHGRAHSRLMVEVRDPHTNKPRYKPSLNTDSKRGKTPKRTEEDQVSISYAKKGTIVSQGSVSEK